MLHGAGGRAMQELVKNVLAGFDNRDAGGIGLDAFDDGAVVPFGDHNMVITTDSHVVRPLFFPGGDIGRLAICGTVNDLAVMGARPVALTSALVIEEGHPIEGLERITASMNHALNEVGIPVVTGDTKVVERGSLDGLIINTTGVGIANHPVSDSGLRPGDKIIVSGTLGDHGLCVLVDREGFDFQLQSDVAPIWSLVEAALDVGGVSAMKDPTRGGLANTLNELAEKSGVRITIDETVIPTRDDVRAAAEMLGIDPLEVANEGKAVIGVSPEHAEDALAAIKSSEYGGDAAIIGEATVGEKVILRTRIGGQRFIDPPLGDPIPRVC